MTNVGQSVLSEYMSEIQERIEDDKYRIRLSQILSVGWGFWRLAYLVVSTFFMCCLILGVIMLSLIDTAMVDAIKAASSPEIVSGINGFIRIAFVLSIVSVMLGAALFSRRYFKNKESERRVKELDRAELIKTIIEVNEEILFRHKLINAGERGNA